MTVVFAGHQGHGHDSADVHIGAVNMHVQLQLLTHSFDVLEALLVVGSCAANPYLDFVLVHDGGKFPQRADDAFECRCDLQKC